MGPAWAGLDVRPADRKGKGLFAKRRYRAGELICTVEGTLWASYYDPDYTDGPASYAIGHGKWIEPHADNPSRFVNHSCEPTARMGEVTKIVALRDIQPGEEVTIDYATTEEDPYWSLECRCGSAQCRGKITATLVFPK